MHELPVISKILDIVLAKAEENQVKEIKTVSLKISALSDLEEEWMQRYFQFLSRETLARSARLCIEKVPALLRCQNCGHEFSLAVHSDAIQVCPVCAGQNYTLQSKRAYWIEHIEAI